MLRTALLFLISVSLLAQDDFSKWFADFRTACAKPDAAAIAKQSKFPMYFENGPAIREIRTSADFEKNFAKYFTPEIRKMIATRTPKPTTPDQRLITWQARGNEYSLYFKRQGAKWIFAGLSEGPP
jgi:hypothetical protein